MKKSNKNDISVEKDFISITKQNQKLSPEHYVRKIEQKVLSFISSEGLLQKDDKVLIALSGGPDSVFLLHILQKLKKKLQIEIAAFHLNHGLRGKNADEDQKFCSNLCKKLAVTFFTEKKNIKLFAEKNKYSIEEAGRIARYSAMQKLCKKYGLNKIATGHNQNDNSETVILNLVKGAGLQAITGIPALRANILRPILNIPKKEILQYLNFAGLSYQTDETNNDNDFDRNILRNEIIPLIKQNLNPSLDESIFRSSQILRKVNTFLFNYISSYIDKIYTNEGDYFKVNLNSLKEVDINLYDLVFRELLNKTGDEFSYKDVVAISGLVNKKTGTSLTLSSGYIANKNREFISLQKSKVPVDNLQVVFQREREVKFQNYSVSICEVAQKPEKYSNNHLVEYISGDYLSDEFVIRFWQPADKFKPLGMTGYKNVSDFLTDIKINPVEKKSVPVVINNGEIIWVAGYRISNDVKVYKNSKKILKLCLTIKKK